MNEHPNKPEWRTSKWWLETFGIYRDERIDDVSFTAQTNLYWAYVILLSITSWYLMWQGHWSGWLTQAIVLATFLYIAKYYTPHRAEPNDEFLRLTYIKKAQIPGFIVVLIPIFFWLAPVETPLPEFVWPAIFSFPALTMYFYLAVSQRTYPMRTTIFMIIMMIAGGVFGFFAALGTFTTRTLVIFGVVYAIILAINFYIWWRQGKQR